MNKIELAKSFIESVNFPPRDLTLKIAFNKDNKDEDFFVSELYEHVFLGKYTFDNLKNLIIALDKAKV